LLTSGIDVELNWLSPRTSLGRFSAKMNGTYILAWRQQLDGVSYTSFLGTNVNGLSVPRWRSYLSLGWEEQSWNVTLAQAYQRSYVDAFPDGEGRQRTVPSYINWDLNLRWRSVSATLTAGVRNLFDRAPPLTNQGNWFQAGYDPRYADPRGRFLYATASWRFR
jgi:iron complex outermembrane receptor protein